MSSFLSGRWKVLQRRYQKSWYSFQVTLNDRTEATRILLKRLRTAGVESRHPEVFQCLCPYHRWVLRKKLSARVFETSLSPVRSSPNRAPPDTASTKRLASEPPGLTSPRSLFTAAPPENEMQALTQARTRSPAAPPGMQPTSCAT